MKLVEIDHETAARYILTDQMEREIRTHKIGEDKAKRGAVFAVVLEKRVMQIMEQNASSRPWGNIDKTKLPPESFLWVEDRKNKSTWHLPYREGAGGIDTETGMYRKAGPVNINALRAIASALRGARTDNPMAVPSEVRSKIRRLMKAHKIGEYREADMAKSADRELIEESLSEQFVGTRLDKENAVVHDVAILRPTSRNSTFREAQQKGRRYSDVALSSTARLITNAKAFADHVTKREMDDRRGNRSIRDLIGYYENGRVDEHKVVRADLHYLRSQREWIEPLIEQMADKIGMSIHAYGPSHLDKSEGAEVVDDVRILASADLVTETGSTRNLFESATDVTDDDQGEFEEDTLDLSAVTLDQLRAENPGLIRSLREEFQTEHESSEKLGGLEKQIKDLREENQTLKQKIDEFEVKEKAAVREQEILDLIEESKLDKRFVTDVFMESLRGAKDTDSMKKLIEDRKKIAGSAKRTGVKDMGDSKEITEDDDSEKPVEEKEYFEATGAKRKQESA